MIMLEIEMRFTCPLDELERLHGFDAARNSIEPFLAFGIPLVVNAGRGRD
jgi:hypothetical protein